MNKETPKKIYLVNGFDEFDDFDWEHEDGIYWSSNKINNSDIEYIKEDVPYQPALLDYIKSRIEDFESVVKDSGDGVDLGYAIKILKCDLDMFGGDE